MKYTSKQIREQFLNYFSKKNHKFVRSAPVIPIGDPTLLFTNAGMNQFKDIFLDKKVAEYKRVVNSQKCIRVSGKHNDLEEVGIDSYHHTLFEMLGNWSFGDYYKKDAIIWAWDLLINVWNIDKKRLWITVYKDDDEAKELWIKHTDIEPSRVLKFGNKENFWEMGEVGPCGPCSEIHYYTGDKIDNQDPNGVNKLSEYREFWNLVFIEYNRDINGELNPLKNKHVDTGMGLERMVAILNGIESNYDTDLFYPIIKEIEELSSHEYTYKNGVPHRVIADHIRMLCCSIADGVMPSNEGRGYVVRRVLRRATRFGNVLDIKDAFLFTLVDAVVAILGDAYSELKEKKSHIKKVIKAEEIAFRKTLDRGLILIDEMIDNLKGKKELSGKDVFKLYDTYGFPVDLTKLIASERNISIDDKEFNKYMKIQRETAKSNQKFNQIESEEEWITINKEDKTTFIGYEYEKVNSKVIKYRKLSNDNIELIAKETPFYAESGGQIGDQGRIYSDDIDLLVLDTYKIGNHICHLCKINKGSADSLDKKDLSFEINEFRRTKIKANHTATHLLHKALKNILGNHVQQAGSLVADDKLRFDLTHYEKLSYEQLSQIENSVNEIIQNNIQLDITSDSFENAKSKGAEALFGEKYDDVVRVVNVKGFSLELCGGTHVNRTGDIGLFKITSESSLASGVRRIEALTGTAAINYINKNQQLIDQIKNKLQCNEENVIKKLDDYINQSKENEKLKKNIESNKIKEAISNFKIIDGVRLIHSIIDFNINPKLLVDVFSEVYNKQTICFVGIQSAKPMMVLALTKDLTKLFQAGALIKDIGSQFDTGGGGPDHFGTAGFKDKNTLDMALDIGLKKIKIILKKNDK